MIGLVTAQVAAQLDPDLYPLERALCDRIGGGAVAVVAWDDQHVDWAAFAAVVIRSTWDYPDRLDEFMRWVQRVNELTVLVNSAEVLRWSADKRYLADLAGEGIPITPTVFVAPGEDPPNVNGLHVVKPSVGAGSSGARRCEASEVSAHVALLHLDGRTAMVQPYLDLLDERGETALCFVADASGEGLEFSHAFRKGAILTSTEVEQTGDLFAKEDISPRVPCDRELALARRALSAASVREQGEVMFARVDVAPGSGDDAFVLMELELIEPSFYFDTEPSRVALFADRLIAWLERRDLVLLDGVSNLS